MKRNEPCQVSDSGSSRKEDYCEEEACLSFIETVMMRILFALVYILFLCLILLWDRDNLEHFLDVTACLPFKKAVIIELTV